MSLVAKYARRDEDSDEESPTVPAVAPTSVPTESKKRESTTETEGTPTAKKAKLNELSDELVLPDYFKDSESTSTSMTGVQETKAPRQMQPTKGGLVPRQLQGKKPNVVTDEELATKLKRSAASTSDSKK